MAEKTPAVARSTRTEKHEAIAVVAQQQGARTCKFNNGVSIHTMGDSTSFTNMRAVMTAAMQPHSTFVGTVNGSLTLSVNFNYQPLPPPQPPARSKKRQRDLTEEAVTHAVERVQRGLTDGELTPASLQHAHDALYSMITTLQGAGGETVLESWGLSYKKMDDKHALMATQQRPRLILSARLTPGVAVPVGQLFRCLGKECSSDGMITVQTASNLAENFRLPLSEQAQTAELHGQKALTLFATVV